MKRLFLIINLFVIISLFGQRKEEAYFHKSFTKRVDTSKISKRSYIRSYVFLDSLTKVTDLRTSYQRKNDKKIREANFYGCSNSKEIDAFFRYHYLLPFKYDSIPDLKNKYAIVRNYTYKGKLKSIELFKNSSVKYIQYFSFDDKPILVKGNGEYSRKLKKTDATNTMIFKDSLLTHNFLFRHKQQDTVYLKTDVAAKPLGGMRNFHRTISTKLKFPEKALRLGRETSITVQFIVNEEGKLVDFEIFGKRGNYNFGKKTIKTIQKLPKWQPGMLNNKPVKTMYRLPVTFALEN
ncbi:energy transducer TonB [uncultured Tenacibaculum sp.]|uniref:energy transducer TonB n=1 Tax=uncultured Tenacibaculum sp. TaxID=174713 RepID=UPI0026025D41|nr:energy transducer TonB [uncultured Tenacibaculum sp.]